MRSDHRRHRRRRAVGAHSIENRHHSVYPSAHCAPCRTALGQNAATVSATPPPEGGVSSWRWSSGLDDRSGGVVLGAVLVRVRVLMLAMVRIFGVTVLVVVMLGASRALMVSLTVRVCVRVLVTGVVGVFGMTVLVLGVLRRALTHRDTPGY